MCEGDGMKDKNADIELQELIAEFNFDPCKDLEALENIINHSLYSLARRFQNDYWNKKISHGRFLMLKNSLLKNKDHCLKVLAMKDFT